MPPKKQEEPKSGAEQCMLKIGRQNNVVQWKEDMQNEACGLYGMTGMFFSTNRHYVQPYPREEDYNPTFQTVDIDDPTAGIENEEDEDGSVDPDDVMIGPQLPPLVPIVYSEALIDKLRAGAFEGRRKAVEAQRTDEQKTVVAHVVEDVPRVQIQGARGARVRVVPPQIGQCPTVGVHPQKSPNSHLR